MRYCANCKSKAGTRHVTIEATVVGATGDRHKIAQFWLCDECERASQKMLARDVEQPGRVARALCTLPQKEYARE